MSRIALLLLLAACGPAPEEEEDPSEHACEHIAEAGTSVTASPTRDGATIDISEEPYTVGLTTGEAGWVSFTVDEDLDALLFAGTADVVNGLYAGDSEDDLLAEAAPNELCPEDIPEHWDLALTAGAWHLQLGPAAITELWLVLMSAEGHAHE